MSDGNELRHCCHCWTSEQRRINKNTIGGDRVVMYCIDGKNVRVDLISKRIDDYDWIDDKVYLGFGTFVSTAPRLNE